MSKIKWNKEDMFQKIICVYKNLHGYRTYSDTPHMALEILVKNVITQFGVPILQCVDLVIEILFEAVSACAEHVSSQ